MGHIGFNALGLLSVLFDAGDLCDVGRCGLHVLHSDWMKRQVSFSCKFNQVTVLLVEKITVGFGS